MVRPYGVIVTLDGQLTPFPTRNIFLQLLLINKNCKDDETWVRTNQTSGKPWWYDLNLPPQVAGFKYSQKKL